MHHKYDVMRDSKINMQLKGALAKNFVRKILRLKLNKDRFFIQYKTLKEISLILKQIRRNANIY